MFHLGYFLDTSISPRLLSYPPHIIRQFKGHCTKLTGKDHILGKSSSNLNRKRKCLFKISSFGHRHKLSSAGRPISGITERPPSPLQIIYRKLGGLHPFVRMLCRIFSSNSNQDIRTVFRNESECFQYPRNSCAVNI